MNILHTFAEAGLERECRRAYSARKTYTRMFFLMDFQIMFCGENRRALIAFKHD